MKTLFLAIAGCAILLPGSLHAQSQPGSTPPVSASSELPHQVGLIDLSYIFSNYAKFKDLTEKLQKDIETTDGKAKTIVERIQHVQSEINSGNLTEQSPEFQQLQMQLIQGRTELETFKRQSQQAFMRQEADIYKTIYLEVEDAVRRYATYYHYTLILRFERKPLSATDQTQEVMNGMNRQVVYFRAQDDITEPILKHLNDQWKQQNHTAADSQSPTELKSKDEKENSAVLSHSHSSPAASGRNPTSTASSEGNTAPRKLAPASKPYESKVRIGNVQVLR